MRLATFAKLILVLLSLPACSSTGKKPAPQVLPVPVANQEYTIQAGDLLDIKFFYNPELNESVTVRPDGRISLQLAKEIKASGTTPAQLTELLSNHYSSLIKSPEITVIVRSFSSQKIYVDGEVNRAGMVVLTDQMTLLQAISQAGGLKDTAETTEVIIVRKSAENKLVTASVNLDNAMNGLNQDPVLMPYDIVLVPKSTIANVDVWVDQYLRKSMPIPLGLGFTIN